jgi:hypothetical protein
MQADLDIPFATVFQIIFPRLSSKLFSNDAMIEDTVVDI